MNANEQVEQGTNATFALKASEKKTAEAYADMLNQNEIVRTEVANNNTQVMASTSSAFPKFSKLPGELQNKIWHTAAVDTEPRVIRILHNRFRKPHYRSDARVPGLMHACRDSRAIASEFYHQYPRARVARDSKVTFVDCEKDIVVFDNLGWLRVLSSPNLKDVKKHMRNLAIRLEGLTMLCNNDNQGFEKLERIYLVGDIGPRGKENPALWRSTVLNQMPLVRGIFKKRHRMEGAAFDALHNSLIHRLYYQRCTLFDATGDTRFYQSPLMTDEASACIQS